jgi:hypothetical protein
VAAAAVVVVVGAVVVVVDVVDVVVVVELVVVVVVPPPVPIVAEEIVWAAVVVQVKGMATVDTPVSDRVKRFVDVNAGRPTLTVPVEPAVMAPETVPGTDTKTLPVG